MHILLLLFVGLALSCGQNIPPPDNAIEDPVALRGGVDARLEAVDSARFKDVVFDYFGDGERLKVRQLILVSKPTYLRVQTRMPGSEEIVSLLVSDGTDFAMHRRDTNEYFSGPSTRQNIGKLLPVDLSAADVARVMLGGAPWDRLDSGIGAAKLSWDRSRGHYKYSVDLSEGGSMSIWVRHTDFAVIEAEERDASGAVAYQYTTDDWKNFGGVSLPEYRRFVWPSRDLDFSMDVNETQLNVELPEHLFTLDPPPGSIERRL